MTRVWGWVRQLSGDEAGSVTESGCGQRCGMGEGVRSSWFFCPLPGCSSIFNLEWKGHSVPPPRPKC